MKFGRMKAHRRNQLFLVLFLVASAGAAVGLVVVAVVIIAALAGVQEGTEEYANDIYTPFEANSSMYGVSTTG